MRIVIAVLLLAVILAAAFAYRVAHSATVPPTALIATTSYGDVSFVTARVLDYKYDGHQMRLDVVGDGVFKNSFEALKKK